MPVDEEGEFLESDEEFLMPPTSEDIGDRNEQDYLEDMEFMERMIFLFRDVDVLGNMRGSGDNDANDTDDDSD